MQYFDRCQSRAELEQVTAAWTRTTAHRRKFHHRQIEREAIAQFDQGTNAIEWELAIGIDKTVVADLHETGGEEVLQETADKLHDIEGKSSGSFAVGLTITDQDDAVLDSDDAGVGDGDPEDVGGEVFESGFAGAHGLAVNIPVDLPDCLRNLIEALGLLDQVAELGAKDFRQGFDGQEEIDFGGMPGAIARADGAACNNVVDVGVILKGSAPGVEHAEEARQIAADVLGIGGEFFD